MISEEFIAKMIELRDEEDMSLWTQGDLLRDTPLTKSEVKKLAEILSRKASTLELRRRVSTETPDDKRRPEYSWSIYSIFIRIEDPIVRWELMFARKEWTITEANEAVKQATYGGRRTPSAISKAMVVGDILVKGKWEKGKLTLRVWLGSEYEVEYSGDERTTTITIAP